MLKDSKPIPSYAVPDVDAAKSFYGDTLGLELQPEEGGLGIELGGDAAMFIYPKPDHEPAGFTVLNFKVDDIEATVDALTEKGVSFERYEAFDHDERGIAQPESGPRIAWFKDPAGNVLSVMSD